MRPEMKAFLAFCVALAVWKVSFSLMARPRVDLDADGQVSITELPRLWAPDFKHEHLGHPSEHSVGLFKFGAMGVVHVLGEAMVYSFGCGMTAVLLCNAVLPGRVPDSFGWILCLTSNVITTITQCMVTTNSIHLLTFHVVHFFYYGFGFLAVASYRRLPSQRSLVVLAVLWYLCLHTAMKYYVWPHYPFAWEFLNTYEYIDDKYVVLSTPDNQKPFYDKMAGKFDSIYLPSTFSMSVGGTLPTRLKWVSVIGLATTYFPFPVYEIICFMIWTSLGYGNGIGLIAKRLARALAPSSNDDESNDAYEKAADLKSSLGLRVADTALLFALLLANSWALLRLNWGPSYPALRQYYPKTMFTIFCNVGALLMLIRRESKGQYVQMVADPMA